MRHKKTILFTILSVVVVVFFVLPAIGFSILRWGVLPPEKLTPLVIEKTNQFIEAHLECERIELTYFETYPYLGVRLTNGRLISHQAEDSTVHDTELAIPSDSLLSFKKAVVVFNPTDYLFGGKITIPRIILEDPRFYGYVNKEGKANWDIYTSEPDTATETVKKPLPPIDLKQVRITNGHFTYNDQSQHLYTEVSDFFLHLNGSLTGGENKLDVEMGTSSLLFRSPAYTLSNKLALKFKSRLLLHRPSQSVALQGAELMINNFPFTAEGSVRALPETQRLAIDMAMGLKVSDLNDLLKFIPDAYFRNRENTLAKGSILLEGDIRGELGDSIVPTVNLCCRIEDGGYRIKGMKQGIDTLQMDIDLHLNGPSPDSSYISIEELTMKGLTTSLDVRGQVFNIYKNPAIRGEIKGKIDFTRLAEEFLNPDTLLLEGAMEANLTGAFTVDDIVNSRYGKVEAAGRLDIDRFKAYSRPLGLDTYIAGAHASVGETEDESQYLNTKGLLHAALSVDTLRVEYKGEISTHISKLDLVANTTPAIDTSAVIPLTARLQFDHLRTRLPDSVWVIAGKTIFRGGIKSSATDKRIPTAGATIQVDTLRYFLIPMRTGLVLAGSTFTLEALPYREALRQRWEQQGRTPRQTPRIRRNAPIAAPTDTISETQQFLRRWEARGTVRFDQMRAFSRYMPIPIRMEQTNVAFNTNAITLTDARLHLGKSDLTLNGEISRIRQALLRGGKLKGDFRLTSDFIDCNQLMQALNNGMVYAESQSSSPRSAGFNEDSLAVLDTQIVAETAATEPLDTTQQLFVVPKFLDMTLHTNAKEIHFNDLELKDVKGKVIVRDQSVNLSDLAMHSNIGCGNLTMVYTAKDRSGATAGFDLDMDDILVDKLISLFPSIDTLVPMLRSFEGVVDCQMTTTCRLDSTMSVLLPSLNSSCYLSGKNMVLLDGETFTEISKTLMFKNKKRNMIDSIAVDLAIHDNKIEVFPFLVEMDRYRVAVGGTHNLDMTFNYHLSVLKSPVPFKLGIDITGNLDDFKFKIVKCRYKDLFKPAKQAELDSTRKNIRQDIREAIRKQIREAAPELVSDLSFVPSHAHVHQPDETP